MSYKDDFIEFMVRSGVLTFGDFITKSGRPTPYFVNTGNYQTSEQIAKLGDFYAQCLVENGLDPDVIYGPAYKGIPLVVTTATSLWNNYKKDIPYSFNRKETKDHGEGGLIIGKKPEDNQKVTIIEDVITAGTSVNESYELLHELADVDIDSLIISVDRMEVGNNNKTAIEEIEEKYGIKTYPIVNTREIIDSLYNKEIDGKIIIDDEMKKKMEDHLEKYGA